MTDVTLDESLKHFSDGQMDPGDLFAELLRANVYVLLDREWNKKEPASPETRLLFVSDGENYEQAMLALFSNEQKARDYSKQAAEFEHALEVEAVWAFRGIQSGCGAIVNPNSEANFRVSPEAANAMREQISLAMQSGSESEDSD